MESTIRTLLEKIEDLEKELQRERNSKTGKYNCEMLDKPNKYGKILNELLSYGDANDFSRLNWRIYMVYMGSPDFSELSIQDRSLIVKLYEATDKYFMKKCIQQDEMETARKS